MKAWKIGDRVKPVGCDPDGDDIDHGTVIAPISPWTVLVRWELAGEDYAEDSENLEALAEAAVIR